ncbi:hypothetical protein SMICM304S_01999 [Streptomyces microflavus]
MVPAEAEDDRSLSEAPVKTSRLSIVWSLR